MIDLLINRAFDFTKSCEEKVLKNASEELTEKYLQSRDSTAEIAKGLFESTQSESFFNRVVKLISGSASISEDNASRIKKLKQYDLLIQEGENLEILMKINEVTQAIKPDLISSQLNKVITFLTNEVLDGKNNNHYIIENMKRRESVYRDFLLKLAEENPPIFWENLSFLMTDCSENNKKEIALAIGHYDLGAIKLARNIFKLSIKDERVLKDIALKIAEHDPGAQTLAENIEHFTFTEEADRVDIALAVAEHQGGARNLAENINNFSITDNANLKKIALKIAERELGAANLPNHIDRFSFFEEAGRIELAFKIAEHDSGAASLAKNIDTFSITDKATLKEIAFKIAEHDSGASSLAVTIDKFSITDKATLKEIAFKIAEHNSGAASLAKNIDTFSITDKATLKEIAFKIAEHNSGAASLAKNIDKFLITDKATLKEIAFKIAEHNSGAASLAKNIDTFSITDKATLQEIAFKIAEHSSGAYNLARNIERFFFSNEADRKRLAFKIAEHDSGAASLAENIDKFSFTEEMDRKQLALKLVEHESGAQRLIDNYKKFQIEDQDFEREIICLAFRWSFLLPHLIRYVEKSGALKDDPSLDPIRKCPKRFRNRVADIKELKKVLIELSGFNSGRIVDRLEPLGDKLDTNDLNLKKIKDYYDVDSAGRPNFQDYKKACHKLSSKNRGGNETKEWAKLSEGLIQEGQYWAPVYDMIEQIAQQDDGDLQYNLTHWLTYSSFRLGEANQGVDTSAPAHTQVLKMIYNVRDQKLRYHLADLFAKHLYDQKDLKTLMTPRNAALTKLLLYDLKRTHPDIKFDTFAKSLSMTFLKDGEKQKILYNALWGLKQSKKVSSEQINNILEHLSGLNSKDLLHELRALNSIISLEKEDRISITDKEEKPLTKSLSDAFAELLPGLNISDPSRFSDLYFGSREPGSLAVYVAGLLKLPPSESETLLATVKTFVEEVDGGSFLTSRYQDSDHLNRIAEADPNILETWKTGKQGLLTDYLEGNSDPGVVEAIMNSLTTKIMADGHLPLDKLPKVAEIFEVEIEDDSAGIDNLDTLLSDLIQNPDLLTIDYLETILDELKELPADQVGEFVNDVVSFIEGLKPKAAKKIERWQIVDSDDPLDLFLSGTEVGGSCQRVDGTPSRNKALMGYVMDGKHRILAVKDSQGKIVERLILRLLLDDKTNEPVLFFERIYPVTAKYGDALKKFAKVRAKELGVPLVSKETRAETKYKGSLISYSSKAPCEYCDAAGGIQTGAFEITGCYQIAPEI